MEGKEIRLADCGDPVTNGSASEALGEDRFAEFEKIKRVALDCARTVLGTTGGWTLRIILHNSKEARLLKTRLTRLRVVRRDIHARKEQSGQPSPPSKAMRRAWDAGLYPQPAEIRTLTALWHHKTRSGPRNGTAC